MCAIIYQYLNYIAFGSKDLDQYLMERSDIHEKMLWYPLPLVCESIAQRKPSPYISMNWVHALYQYHC